MTIEQQLSWCQTHVNDRLSYYLPERSTDPLRCAMRYSTLSNGKRLRPFLVYLTAKMLGLESQQVDPIAIAIECIHCYSLIHDDLPAMDNDDLRRGKPTCHRAFGEASAILAGDGLLTLAFEILTQDNVVPTNIIHLIAKAAGMQGMVNGQSLDLTTDNEMLTFSKLIEIHHAKTGALITASVLAGAMASNDFTIKEEQALTAFGQSIGLAFQIQDDILDATESRKKQKCSFVTFLGIEEAHRQAKLYYNQSLDALCPFGQKADDLRAISAFMIERES